MTIYINGDDKHEEKLFNILKKALLEDDSLAAVVSFNGDRFGWYNTTEKKKVISTEQAFRDNVVDLEGDPVQNEDYIVKVPSSKKSCKSCKAPLVKNCYSLYTYRAGASSLDLFCPSCSRSYFGGTLTIDENYSASRKANFDLQMFLSYVAQLKATPLTKGQSTFYLYDYEDDDFSVTLQRVDEEETQWYRGEKCQKCKKVSLWNKHFATLTYEKGPWNVAYDEVCLDCAVKAATHYAAIVKPEDELIKRYNELVSTDFMQLACKGCKGAARCMTANLIQ